MIYRAKQKSGFTIVETLVALSIFSVAVIALMTVTITGSNGTSYVKNKLTASYLAQEGIELVRNLRDTASFVDPQQAWNLFLGNPIGTGSTTNGIVGLCVVSPGTVITPGSSQALGCSIEQDTNNGPFFENIQACASSGGGCELMDDGFAFKYAAIPSGEDHFTRYITIQEIDNVPTGTASFPVKELLITSYVFWTKGITVAGSVQYTERLFDWTTNLN